jgi:hypothetical protein
VAKTIQFEGFAESDPKLTPHCLACEAMLADAVDGTLGEVDKAWFDRHVASCVVCAERMADAQRGSAWLEMLKSTQPEPSQDLVARIMAATAQGTATDSPFTAFTVAATEQAKVPVMTPMGTLHVPAIQRGGKLVPFVPPAKRGFSQLFETRLVMTAAMAFFSIALTLNLTGVRLNELHASDLKPASVRKDVFQARAKAVQYYDNLRVVHVMESRLEDLREANAEREQQVSAPVPRQTEPAPEQKQDKQPAGPGSSRRESPLEAPRLMMVEERTGFWDGAKAGALGRETWQMQGGRS